MYFLSHIKNQYFNIFENNFQPSHVSEAPVGDSPSEQELAANAVGLEKKYDNLSSSELLEELKQRLDTLKSAESIVGPEAQVLIRFCNKVKDGKIDGLGPEDADFVRLSGIALRKVEEYQGLAKQGHDIQGDIQLELQRLGGEVREEIKNPEGKSVLDDSQEKENIELQSLLDSTLIFGKSIRDEISEFQENDGEDNGKDGEDKKQLYLFSIDNPLSMDSETLKGIAEISKLSQEVTGIYEGDDSTEVKIQKITQLKSQIEDIYKGINIENQFAKYEYKLKTEAMKPLSEGEKQQLEKHETQYKAGLEPILMKLKNFLAPNLELTNRMGDVVERYKQINISSITDMTERQRLSYLKDADPTFADLHRLVDIAVRDEGIIEGTDEKLGEVREKSSNAAYEKALNQDGVKESLRDAKGNIPTFEELRIEDIKVLVENGVSLGEMFLVDEKGSSIEGNLQEGGTYIINFGENKHLSDTLDFAFLTTEFQQIIVDGEPMKFSEDQFKSEKSGFQMKDGSQITLVEKFTYGVEPAKQRLEGAKARLDKLALTSAQQQIVDKAFASDDPFAAAELPSTLPGGLMGFFMAMVLNIGDGRNFTYDSETRTWVEKVADESGEPLTNLDVTTSNLGAPNLNTDAGLESQPAGVKGLIAMIYQKESRGNPKAIFGGYKGPRPDITKMTVSEVLNFQNRMVREYGAKSSAVGAPQIIRKTMRGAIASGALKGNELFDSAAQNRFTLWKMEQRGLNAFKRGTMSEARFMEQIAMEWASFPKDMNGRSYYAGDGLNKALINPKLVREQLRRIKA